MKYIRLFLKGYKPLIYGGIHQLELSDMSQINILSGENGKGKSSVLRELTPYPATRTDYEKNGLKIIEIQHEKDYYILTSDFSKTSAHSFIRNNEELNISGTTDVQEDLIQHYFDGFTHLIEKLTSGQCKFSQLGRPERSKIIMATYPSSMLFILDKYKNLMTKIRSCNSQLKLMNERKLKLKESFIDDSKLTNHNNLRKLMNETIVALDQDILIMTNYLNSVIATNAYRYNDDITIDSILARCKEIKLEFKLLSNEMEKSSISFKNSTDLRVTIQLLESELTSIEKESLDLTTRGSDVLDEIEKYNTYLKTDKEQAISECEQMISTQKEIITEFTINDDTPVVDIDEASTMREHSSKIQENLQYLKSLNIELWSEDQFIEKERFYRELESEKREKVSRVEVLLSDKQKLQYRLRKYTEHPARVGCQLKCPLKDSVSQITDSIKIEIESLDESIQDYNSSIDLDNMILNSIKNDLQVRSAARPIIDRFERLIHNKSWGNFVCSNESFISAANKNIIQIWNNYVRIIKKSEACDRVKKAKEMLLTLEARLVSLKTDNQPAKQVISETLVKREIELKKITDKKTELHTKAIEVSRSKNYYSKHSELIEKIENILEKWGYLKEHIEATEIVKFVKDRIDDMTATKIQISERLRELDTIAREQENLRTRLNDEVEPVINELTNQLQKWKAIERVLSPTKGIPNNRIVKYINAIFVKANTFIKQVWNYDMELEYLKENEECDYTFRVLINGDGVVKDINTCSKGQKEIIDLAIILAICKYRKYSIFYPIKLDEMSSGLSPDHSSKLFEYLGELFHQSNILQAFIVNHDPVITSSYTDASYAVLSDDYPMPASCKVISKIN